MTRVPGFLQPQSLKSDGDALRITWGDGVEHRLEWKILRKACPCATCRTEADKPPAPQSSDNLLPVLAPQEIIPLRPLSMRPMGNYAYHIDFSDGHNTGIYTLEYLRMLGEEATKRQADIGSL